MLLSILVSYVSLVRDSNNYDIVFIGRNPDLDVVLNCSLPGGSPYPRMDGKKIVNWLQQGHRMSKPRHVDDKL